MLKNIQVLIFKQMPLKTIQKIESKNCKDARKYHEKCKENTYIYIERKVEIKGDYADFQRKIRDKREMNKGMYVI